MYTILTTLEDRFMCDFFLLLLEADYLHDTVMSVHNILLSLG